VSAAPPEDSDDDDEAEEEHAQGAAGGDDDVMMEHDGPEDSLNVLRAHSDAVRNLLRVSAAHLFAARERERERTWWAHTGGGEAFAFKPSPNATR
jgi:hypothetical protein